VDDADPAIRSDIPSKPRWKSLPLAVKAIAVAGSVFLAVGLAYLVVTWVLIGLASLGIAESCKPGC